MRYKAFISYSHAADGKLAPALQSALHHFAKPWYRLRAIRTFRDKTSLAVTPALWRSIERALLDSEYFILLGSPAAAKSHWVQKEAVWWLENKSADRFLIVVTDGAVGWDNAAKDFDSVRTTALPPNLRGAFKQEPLYVELQWAREQEHLSLKDSRFLEAITRLAATLHGRPLDEIAGEDVRQHRRTVRTAWGAVAALLLLTIFATGSAYYATQQRAAAEHRLADSLLANAVASGARGRWLEMQQVGAEARDLLIRQDRSPFPVDLQIWRSYSYAPPPLYSYAPPGFMTFLPDRQHGLALDGSKALLVDIKTHRVVGTFVEAPQEILGIWFAPNGRLFVTEGPDHILTVWHYAKRHPIRRLVGHKTELLDLAISNSGRFLVSTSEDNTTLLWDIDLAKPLYRVAEGDRVRGLAFTPDERSILFGSYKSTHRPGTRLTLWDIATAKEIRSFDDQREAYLQSVAISSDGRYALSGGQFVQLWDLASGKRLQRFLGAEQPIFLVAFSPDNRFVLASMGAPGGSIAEGSIGVWNIQRGNRVYTFDGHSSALQESLFSPHGVVLHHTRADRGFVSVYIPDKNWISVQPGQGMPMRLEFSPDAHLLVAIHRNGTHSVWDVATGMRIIDFPVGGRRITRFRFSSDGKRAVFSATDGSVGILDVGQLGDPRIIQAHKSVLVDAAISSDGTKVLTLGEDKTAKYWDVKDAQVIRSIVVDGVPGEVAFALTDRVAVISGTAGFMVWNLDSGDTKAINEEFVATSWASSVSLDGYYCKGGRDFAVERWDLRRYEKVASYPGHKFAVSACDFSVDGRWLVSGSYDQTIRFWDTESGRGLLELFVGKGIHDMRLSSDMRYAGVGQASGDIHILHLARPREYGSLAPKVDQAIATLAARPRDMDSLKLLARWYVLRQIWRWSVELFEEVIQAGGQPWHVDLARGYWMLGRYDDASREFAQALQREEAPEYYLRLCRETVNVQQNEFSPQRTP